MRAISFLLRNNSFLIRFRSTRIRLLSLNATTLDTLNIHRFNMFNSLNTRITRIFTRTHSILIGLNSINLHLNLISFLINSIFFSLNSTHLIIISRLLHNHNANSSILHILLSVTIRLHRAHNNIKMFTTALVRVVINTRNRTAHNGPNNGHTRDLITTIKRYATRGTSANTSNTNLMTKFTRRLHIATLNRTQINTITTTRRQATNINAANRRRATNRSRDSL